MGATYQPNGQQCQLSTQMSPVAATNRLVHSLLRVAAPSAVLNSTISVVNGAFDGSTLAPWTSFPALDGTNLTAVNGAAQGVFDLSNPVTGAVGAVASQAASAVTQIVGGIAGITILPPIATNTMTNALALPTSSIKSSIVSLQQALVIPAGWLYYVASDIAVQAQGDVQVVVGLQTDAQSLVSSVFSAGQSFAGTVNANGVMRAAGSTVAAVYVIAVGSAGAVVRLDNVILNAWPPTSGISGALSSLIPASPPLSLPTAAYSLPVALPTGTGPITTAMPSTMPRTTPTSSSSFSRSSTSSCLARATLPPALCPQSDGANYAGCDGSQYLVVCGQDYNTRTIPGIFPFITFSLSACIDFCTNQGTRCSGVTWAHSTRMCSLKGYNMYPTINTGVEVHAAVRMTGPANATSPINAIINGNFNTYPNNGSIIGWTTPTPTPTGLLSGLLAGVLNLVSGLLRVVSGTLALVLTGSNQAIELSQSLSFAAGVNWFLTLNLDILQFSTDGFCDISFQSPQETLWTYRYYGRAGQQHGRINGSGLLQYPATAFQPFIYCNSTTNATVGLSDVQWWTYNNLIQGLSPIVLPVTQVLADATLQIAGALSPWRNIASDSCTYITGAGAAVMKWTALLPGTVKIAQFYQPLNTTAQLGQTYHLVTTGSITMPSLLGTGLLAPAECTLSVLAGAELWNSGGVSVTSTFTIDRTGVLAADATNVTLQASCFGPSTGDHPIITWKTAYLTLNV